MPDHSTLTGSDLHEPKGVAAANSGEVYVADGLGSGSWDPLEATEVASTGAADKSILVADGAGNIAWQEYPYGGLYYEDRTTPITITGSGATSDIKISDVLTTEAAATNTSSEFTVGTDGELQYTGTLSRHFHVVCQASIDLSTGATNSVAASIYKYDDSGAAWSRVTGSDAITVADNSTIAFIATHTDVMLDTNDKLVLALQNISGSTDVRMYTHYLFAMGMPGT